MAPDELTLVITLNPAGPDILYFYVSVKLDAYSLYSMVIFVAISYQGHRFFAHKIFTTKNKVHAKRKPMHDTLAFEWFSFSRNV